MAQKGKRNVDHKLLLALACGASVEVAARETGLSVSTIYRRLKDAEFKRELQKLRGDMVQRAAGMLTAAGLESVKTMVELQKSTVPPGNRLAAARSVLEFGLKLREATDLEERLAALEQLHADAQPKERP